MSFRKKLFFCYDVRLHLKLQELGFEFATCSLSLDGKKYWLYERTEELHKAITQ
ncbi:hypothetical protein ABET51_06640 [Metabacillus fastidiosus]|uniref:hypothetical protein n=1 Tax=Metabacillus fastidiosus TaxID=1458 RepID=UPI003D2E803D